MTPFLRAIVHPPRKPAWLHWSIRLGRILGLWYLFTVLFTWLVADTLTFPIPPTSYQTVPGQMEFQAEDGTPLIGCWLPQEQSNAPTILFFHGNGEDLGHLQPFLRSLQGLGVNLFAYDYRGYGRSGGQPTERGLYRDAEAAYRLVTETLGIAANNLFLFGRSLGSGSACYLAAQHSVAGLILDSPFTSTFRVVLPFPPLPNDQFPNLRRLRHIRAPILLIHGTRDEVVPFSHGERLARAAQSPVETFWIEGAGHNNLVASAGQGYWDRIRDFINRHRCTQGERGSPRL
ncbi:MAG: hypothetical protein OHK005_09750 [Candidatus Methylacidiphilales bacterium]